MTLVVHCQAMLWKFKQAQDTARHQYLCFLDNTNTWWETDSRLALTPLDANIDKLSYRDRALFFVSKSYRSKNIHLLSYPIYCDSVLYHVGKELSHNKSLDIWIILLL